MQAVCKSTIKKNTIEKLKRLGVFKKEYDDIIDLYAESLEQYRRLNEQFKKSGYDCVCTTADGGMKKDPIVAVIESLRKDILQYSDRLCLNPKAMADKGTKAQDDGGVLAKVLKDLG